MASLWKVDDIATAALMSEFYRQLWEKNLPPVEALHQAQLAVYRADAKKFAEMAKRGLEVGDKNLDKFPIAADPKGRNHPALWAAFILSGDGR